MSKCWYCNEELTTANYCDEHIGICTKCYDSMFKVSNEFAKCLTDKIADLEAKLAEKEETINNLEQQCLICNKDQENERLKQQLAEKENTITNLIEDTNASKEFYKKQFNEQVWLCEELREQLDEDKGE